MNFSSKLSTYIGKFCKTETKKIVAFDEYGFSKLLDKKKCLS